jgi:hypothetical protein
MHAGTLRRANTSALVVVVMVLGGEDRGEGRGRVGDCVLAGGGDNSRGDPSCANKSSCGGAGAWLPLPGGGFLPGPEQNLPEPNQNSEACCHALTKLCSSAGLNCTLPCFVTRVCVLLYSSSST